jgi:hypothetical protein
MYFETGSPSRSFPPRTGSPRDAVTAFVCGEENGVGAWRAFRIDPAIGLEMATLFGRRASPRRYFIVDVSLHDLADPAEPLRRQATTSGRTAEIGGRTRAKPQMAAIQNLKLCDSRAFVGFALIHENGEHNCGQRR